MSDEAQLRIRDQPGGEVFVELVEGEDVLCKLSISPFVIRVGVATLRMDGIGSVETQEERRNSGYARQVMTAALDHIKKGDAVISMLYGIPDFYTKFGYATGGPDHLIVLRDASEGAKLPPGWSSRGVEPSDVPVVHRLYERLTSRSVGASVRRSGCPAWAAMERSARDDKDTEFRVVLDPSSTLRGYVWRGTGFWYQRQIQKENPKALVFSEALADGPMAADTVLAVCRIWTAGEWGNGASTFEHALISAPPEGAIAAAAMRTNSDLVQRWSASGDCLARTISPQRLMASLLPELKARAKTAGLPENARLMVSTEIGEALIDLSSEAPGRGRRSNPTLFIPQADLARLALGTFSPEDVLDRIDMPALANVRDLVVGLFPKRRPHMYVPDRF